MSLPQHRTVLPWNFPRPRGNYRGFYRFRRYGVILYWGAEQRNSEQPGDVVVELGGQSAGVQLVEIHQLDQIHEFRGAAIQTIVDQTVHLQLPKNNQTHWSTDWLIGV